MDKDQFDEIAERVANELRADAERDKSTPRLRTRARRAARHEVTRVAHEIALATAGVVASDVMGHRLIEAVTHTIPAMLG